VLVVVVAADDDHARARGPQREQRVPYDALRVRERRRGFEEVAGDEHTVDVLGRGQLGDLGEDGAVLVES